MMKIKTMITALGVLIGGVVFAQENTTIEDPHIRVVGMAEKKIAPDYAELTIGLRSLSDSAIQAKNEANETIAKMLMVLRSYKISDEQFTKSNLNLYSYNQPKTSKKQFHYNQSFTIRIDDLAIYQQLVDDLIDAGANYVEDVNFKSSQIEKFMSELRQSAFQDAKKKAQDFARATSTQTLGEVYSIIDLNRNTYAPMYLSAKMSDASMTDDTKSSLVIPIGQIKLEAGVDVIFYLN